MGFRVFDVFFCVFLCRVLDVLGLRSNDQKAARRMPCPCNLRV